MLRGTGNPLPLLIVVSAAAAVFLSILIARCWSLSHPLVSSPCKFLFPGVFEGMQLLTALLAIVLGAVISFIFAPAVVTRDQTPLVDYSLQDPGDSHIALSVVIPAYNEELRRRGGDLRTNT